ncbi:MAG: SpoIIIAC/SpoIIIAD family protein [Cellulosilyticaceae bacterium]
MEQILAITQLGGLALAIGLIVTLVKKSGYDTAATIISIIGTITMLIIAAEYIKEFFEVIQTMLVF